MNESEAPNSRLNRRDLVKGVAAAGVALTAGIDGTPQTAAAVPARDNRITKENARPGTRDWLLTKTDITANEPVELWRSPQIEGYCSETSVAAGDTLRIMVSTNPVSEFDLEIFRTGYYGGDGGRSVKKYESIQGKTQPVPPVGKRRVRECTWEASVDLTIPEDWLSGVYLGKLTAKEEGVQSYVIFIVRDDRPCDLLFQCSDMTWSAYNSWPTNEYSLYHNDANGYTGYRKRKKWSTNPKDTGWVSFDRPYSQFCQDHLVKFSNSVGTGEFLPWEFPLSYWIEQQGYDVSYISNVDTHRHGPRLQRTKGFISVGHDEYWTRQMYDNVAAARDAGVNLAFLSGNSVWGMVPLTPSSAGQDHRVFSRGSVFVGEFAFEELRPELRRKAKERIGDFPPGPDGALLMGGRMGSNSISPAGGPWTCAVPEHWLYEGTGMKKGDAVEGLIGWEWHSHPARELPGHEVLTDGKPMRKNGKPFQTHMATIYDGPRGNVVFNAGTIWWARGVSSPPGHVLPAKTQGPDPRVQRMMANVFDRFIS